jgi:hypothetical protein
MFVKNPATLACPEAVWDRYGANARGSSNSTIVSGGSASSST